jgi:hypothetical protein
MHLRKKPEIELLDAATWARIEGNLFDELELRRTQDFAPHGLRASRATRWRSAVALAVAAAAVVVGLAWEGGRWQARSPIASAVTPGSPSRIVTYGDGSHFEVSGAALDVSPEATLLVSGDDEHGLLVVLDRGSVTCEVPPRNGRPPFVVQAGDVNVRVIGTHFTVRRTGASGGVQVDRGVVEVTARGEVTLVRAGASWPPPPSPVVTDPSVGGHAGGDVAERDPSGARPSVTPKSPSPQELYETATAFEGRRPDRSIAIYKEIAKGSGPWAANALFAQGRLEADRGHRAEARLLLSEYLKRFSRGGNAEDARQLLERL